MKNRIKKVLFLAFAFLLNLVFFSLSVQAQVIREIIKKDEMEPIDQIVLNYAKQMSLDCRRELEKALDQKEISENELFNTLYFPEMPLGSPPTYQTFYTKLIEKIILPIEDWYVESNPKIVFAILVDINGYLPAHNTRFSKPKTGNLEFDLKNNRTKRIFNDITGFSAAINKREYLLQTYSRDSGEIFMDLSVPVYVKGRHWGAVRIGYNR